MKRLLAAVLASVSLKAAILRGTVVERETGKALARALVAVHPVRGSAGATQSVRANNYGVFEFPPMAAGVYLVSISRKGFATVQYGQAQWNAPGKPAVLSESGETVLRVALPRWGSISGRISDEADVGLVEHDVIAYRNTRPPVMVAKAVTDDRGVYRIHGLEPGAYLVRTAAKQYDDGGYLPTFYKESSTAERGNPVEVAMDREMPDVNVRPAPGRLYTIGGEARGPGTQRDSVEISLISDMGVERVTADGSDEFRFQPAAPGKYELLARSASAAAWLAVEIIDRDRDGLRLNLEPVPQVAFEFQDGAGARVDAAGLMVLARRNELSGRGPVQYVQAGGGRVALLPGRWEFSLAPNESYYASGWVESTVRAGMQEAAITLKVGADPGALHGLVAGESPEPAAGAPVYLEHEGEVRNTRTDVQGKYRFIGLAPGTYRVWSTFGAPGREGGRTVRVEAGSDAGEDLVLIR